MTVINVLTTNEIGETVGTVSHDDLQLVFEKISAGVPPTLSEGPVWAFVDWAMPELSGLEMCRRLRADARTADAHLTVVLDHDDIDHRRRALQAGADDYLLGPLSKEQMVERILALVTTTTNYRTVQLIERGEFEIDMSALLVRYRKRPIRVQSGQFRLLCYFVENANRVLTRDELIHALGKLDPPINQRTVDKWVVRLRRSLQDVNASLLLRTVHGLGYVFDIV